MKKETMIQRIIKLLNSAFLNDSAMVETTKKGLLKLDYKTLDALYLLILTSNVKGGK